MVEGEERKDTTVITRSATRRQSSGKREKRGEGEKAFGRGELERGPGRRAYAERCEIGA